MFNPVAGLVTFEVRELESISVQSRIMLKSRSGFRNKMFSLVTGSVTLDVRELDVQPVSSLVTVKVQELDVQSCFKLNHVRGSVIRCSVPLLAQTH